MLDIKEQIQTKGDELRPIIKEIQKIHNINTDEAFALIILNMADQYLHQIKKGDVKTI